MRTTLLALTLATFIATPGIASAYTPSLDYSIGSTERLLPLSSSPSARARASDLLAAARQALAAGDEATGWRLLDAAVAALQPGLSSANDHG